VYIETTTDTDSWQCPPATTNIQTEHIPVDEEPPNAHINAFRSFSFEHQNMKMKPDAFARP
jgi:hypothetical protein